MMKTPIVSIIVAMSANRGIGRNNDLMWHLPEDMKFFKDKTLGHPVIMGRKNYESIPEKYRPFKNRLNIVISSQLNYNAPDCILVQNLEDALVACVGGEAFGDPNCFRISYAASEETLQKAVERIATALAKLN